MGASVSTEQARQQFLRFQLPDGTLAMIAAQHLAEILSLDLHQVIPIPDMEPSMMGVCNWRGEVLWLLDLGAWLGLEALYTNGLQRGKLNVLTLQHQGITLGLGVAQVEQMVLCDLHTLKPAPTQNLSSTLASCVQGYWVDPQGSVVLGLDGTALMQCFHQS
ncbi:MAG TPA: chemotaxis protein CheW [Stenomitos sp.]